MAESSRARGLTTRKAWILLLLLMVVKTAIELLIQRGGIRNRNVADVLEWVPFLLNLSGVVLLLVIFRRWETTTRYARRLKVLVGVYVAYFVIAVLSLRFGLTSWLDGLGRPVPTIVYAASSLVLMTIIAAICVMGLKDMEERTAREVRAKLRHHAEEAEAPLNASS